MITLVDVSEPKRLLAEEALRTLNRTLEQCVADRTAALEAALRALQQQTNERVHAEAMLRHAQKLEALGKLTGGIAHDFNNLLGVIIGNAECLLDNVSDPDQAQMGQEILRSALNGAELTPPVGLRADAAPAASTHRSEHVAPRPCSDAGSNPRREHPDHNDANAGAVANPPRPISGRGCAAQSCAQCGHAIPRGGSLAIGTANCHLTAGDVFLDGSNELSERDFVVLTVTDTGNGMPVDVLERATEPFFTTKPPSVGSGLGLSMVYGFARQSGGHLTIASEVGVGTTVRLYLPRAEIKAATEYNASDEDAHSRRQ